MPAFTSFCLVKPSIQQILYAAIRNMHYGVKLYILKKFFLLVTLFKVGLFILELEDVCNISTVQ
jgi:hypothetical protein